MEDRLVISKVKNGDAEAFAILVEKYHRRLLTFIYRLVQDKKLVEDIGQDVFLHVYKSLKDFDEDRGTPFSAWLFTVARNRCMDELRKGNDFGRIFIEEVDADGLAADSPTAECLLMENERREAVDRSLARMSERLRKPILMRLRGSSFEAIAKECGISAATAKSRVFRAKEKMMLLIGKYFGGKRYERV